MERVGIIKTKEKFMKKEEKLEVAQEVAEAQVVEQEAPVEEAADEAAVEEVAVEETKEEVKKEPKLSPEQKKALEKEMRKLKKIPDAMQMQQEKGLTDLELVTLRSGIIGHLVRMYSRKAIADIYEYAIDNEKTLIDLVDEVKAKKSPLSAVTRKLLLDESNADRLNYLAIAALVYSGITYNTEAVEVAEAEEVPEAPVEEVEKTEE